MRIITGKYKGRHFDVPRSFKARPTTDFAKENIFNVLLAYVDFDEATALDLFSGTGSIALELLSRGCRQVISVEQDRDHHRFISECVRKLTSTRQPSAALLPPTGGAPTLTTPQGNPPAATIVPIRGDAFRFVKSCQQQFDLVFADPPYALKELPTLPDLVMSRQLLKPDGVFVLEHGKDYDFTAHPHFAEHRAYGSVNFSLFVNNPEQKT